MITTHMIRRAAAPVFIVVAVMLAGGCSSSAPEVAPATTEASASATGVVLTVTGTEYAFEPADVAATAGPTTIRFINEGAVEHNFSIEALGIDLTAQPGKTAEATLTLEPGTYATTCAVAGHVQSGMQGTLTVA